MTKALVGDAAGHVTALRATRVDLAGGKLREVPGPGVELPADLVLLAMGFVGPEREGVLSELGVEIDERGNVARDANWQASQEGVFVCGDMGRGQSLIVWAIAEGRAAAASVDRYLVGDTVLPEPVVPTSMPMR